MLQPVYLYLITPHAGLQEDEFEKLLTEKVFPDLQVLQRNVRAPSTPCSATKAGPGRGSTFG
jgi:hypothetical protein